MLYLKKFSDNIYEQYLQECHLKTKLLAQHNADNTLFCVVRNSLAENLHKFTKQLISVVLLLWPIKFYPITFTHFFYSNNFSAENCGVSSYQTTHNTIFVLKNHANTITDLRFLCTLISMYSCGDLFIASQTTKKIGWYNSIPLQSPLIVIG